MFSFTNTVVCIMHAFNRRKCLVEIGLLHVPCIYPMAIDFLEGRAGVDADCIWGPADNGTVFPVQSVEKEVPVTLVGVPCCGQGSDFAENGAGVLGEGVQEDPVEAEGEKGDEGDGS